MGERFDAGEVEGLREAFGGEVGLDLSAETIGTSTATVPVKKILGILKGVSKEYESVSEKDFDYVLREAGVKGKEEVGWNEFLEVGLSLSSLCHLVGD
jgi:glycerol-3-phosphate dehydrogenase